MPVREGSLRKPGVPDEKTLRGELEAELRNPKDSGEPDIIIDRANPSTTHLYVIWSKWGDLEQMVRSRIILDAFTEVRGEEEAIDVTVSMGLTPSEADRLGVK